MTLEYDPSVMRFADLEAAEHSLVTAHAALVAKRIVAPLELGGGDERRWLDCDMASFAENRIGERVDPWDHDPGTRDRWTSAVLERELSNPHRRSSDGCYWIVRDGERVGTLGLSRYCLNNAAIASSVYLRPRYRGTGIMTATLRDVCAELASRDLGLRLEALWTWQNAVRFYLRIGFWVRMWKRDLQFVWYPRTPSPIIKVGDRDASLAVELDGDPVVLARSRRYRRRLVRLEAARELPEAVAELSWDARTTLALAIALAGWPLVRSRRSWQRGVHSDALHPEGLARRIAIWEAGANARGWLVETPRLPGVEYPTWAALEARWKAAEARYLRQSG